jgi:hypothetical protein
MKALVVREFANTKHGLDPMLTITDKRFSFWVVDEKVPHRQRFQNNNSLVSDVVFS